jgi:chemotaxis protein methyltransferase CheR
MTDEEFFRIKVFLKSRYGINLENKKEIVAGRLSIYLARNGYKSCTEFMNCVENDCTGKLEIDLVNILTTNHTYFMREFEHFDFLKREVLPWLKVKESAIRDLCVWCGAASSGEEPYMLAMLLKFFCLEPERWDTKVLATDISVEVLAKAVEGIYTAEQVEKLPDSWKRRFFRKTAEDNYVVSNEIKNEVIFRRFNLMDPFPFKRKMHIIFMRNVMIYFDNQTKKQLIKKIYDVMEPGGYLFVGRTETIDGGDIPFEMIQPSIFRKPLAVKQRKAE